MGRPPLALGTWGDIRTYVASANKKTGKPTSYRAVAYYRDYDGHTRQYERSGKTPAAAANNLRVFLKERTDLGTGGTLTRQHRFSDAAALWLAKIDETVSDGSRSPGTAQTYRRHLNNHVLPALGELRLGEVTTPLVDRFIGGVKKSVGAPTAKGCRSVTSGVMGLAVRKGAGTANPVREVERIEASAKRKPRALTLVERREWISQLSKDEKASNADLPDLCCFMLSTGVRIGEALAVLGSEVDLQSGTAEITSTIIRVTGMGLVRKATKSKAGERLLLLPPWAIGMLEQRSAAGLLRFDRPVFADSLGGFRDPSNTQRSLREARGSSGFAWVTSHVFRKTAATILDEAGLSARQIADQLGQARPSMTQDVYIGRNSVNPRAASALEEGLNEAS